MYIEKHKPRDKEIDRQMSIRKLESYYRITRGQIDNGKDCRRNDKISLYLKMVTISGVSLKCVLATHVG